MRGEAGSSGASWTRTLVVCGDSTASALGLPQDSIRADYPTRLRTALRPRGFRVISHARPDRPIAATLDELDRVIALDPDVVLISHGGLENTVRMPRALRYLPVPPMAPGQRRRPLHRIRRVVYAPLLAMLRRPVTARLLEHLGIGPGTGVDRIHRQYSTLIAELLERTSAHLVLVTPPTGRMSFQPWNEEGLARLRVFAHRQAAASPRVTVVDLREELAGVPAFQADGTHLSVEGHAMAFEVVRRALVPSMLPLRLPVPLRAAIAG